MGPEGISIGPIQCFRNANCRCGCQGDPSQPRLTAYHIQGEEYNWAEGPACWIGTFSVEVWATSAAEALKRFAAAASQRRKHYRVTSISMVPEIYQVELGCWVPYLYESGQPLVSW